jgi:hypothetical protein
MDLVYGTTDVLVSDDDITDLSIALRPGQAVSGRVIFSGTRARVPTDLSRVVVSMVPEVTDLDPVATEVFTQPNQDGSFVIRNVLPGRYHLSAMAAGGWNLASARVGSHDTLDEPIVVTSGQNLSNAEIMFSDRATEFLGVVEDNSGTRIPGAIVVIYPSDNTQRRWTSRRIASTRSATDGAFVFRGLPPGEYRIAIAPETARTPIATSLLDELDSTASTVSLGDGIKTSGTIVRR